MKAEQIQKLIQDKKLCTPCYILDMDVLAAHVDRMKAIAGDTASFVYAMKANPFLVSEFNYLADKIEVCSPGELKICREYQIPGSRIIFSGVNKTKEDVEAAFEYGVSVITIESNKHFRLVCEYCKEHRVTAEVLLRLTNGSQFGMDEDAIEKIVRNRSEYPFIHIKGIHFFSGTQKKKLDKLTQELDELDELMNKLQGEYGLKDLTLEYGAGLAVPYFEGEDFDILYDSLEKLTSYIKAKQRKYDVVWELGRYFSFSCGTYITTVEDVKCNKGHNYVIVDGGIHHLNYYGQNMAMRIPKMELISSSTEYGECTICGSLCTLADVLVRRWDGVLPKEGDVFLFYNAGSYSITEAPALFLSRRMPTVYRYAAADGLKVIRASRESYIQNCRMNVKL